MKVSTSLPFKLIYSVFEHELLGYLFGSYVIQLNHHREFTLSHQHISYKNAPEFSSELDKVDYSIIKLVDAIQKDHVMRIFDEKNQKPDEFFSNVYNKENGNEALQEQIEDYLEEKRGQILKLLKGKWLFEMGRDGEPAGKRIEILNEPATVLFHFRRNKDNTHYFPTIKQAGQKVDFRYNGAIIICKKPAWMILKSQLYRFKGEIDGHKLIPFLNKRFIAIPKSVEETYFRKFVSPLVATCDVFAQGFDIKTHHLAPAPIINIRSLKTDPNLNEESLVEFTLYFKYGTFCLNASQTSTVKVELTKIDDKYTFHRISRNFNLERSCFETLCKTGMDLTNSSAVYTVTQAFKWVHRWKEDLQNQGYQFLQDQSTKIYFLDRPEISLEVKESIDWFDINAMVKFGEFEIPFWKLRKQILRKKREFILPNGEVAVIPEKWFNEYSELFAFMEQSDSQKNQLHLKKHHLALVNDLETGKLAKVSLSSKLSRLRQFDRIQDQSLSSKFRGTLRPYQKAGFNWLRFLSTYNLGGCLADDMGLGKTVQTLAMLQSQYEQQPSPASLLIMPTSLIYNWELEAKKFTPKLKLLVYSGTQRNKDEKFFSRYDLILTSYGIVRLDIEILQKYYFNYVILDESQAIKNPRSIIAKAVNLLKSKQRLILTGTPLENSTLDLWSQMNFINPGLLGSQSFFKNEFQFPIEKKHDQKKTSRLLTIIKPFILRRQKSQVASEIPEKVESIHYCSMTAMQEEKYQEIKSQYQNQILDSIETRGLNRSHMLLLTGLSKLRQIANHPYMIDLDYKGDSGKLKDAMHMLQSGVSEGHKILVFSQFVKLLSIFKGQLNSKEIEFAYLDGSTKDRKTQVERFQHDPDTKIFLISLKAGGLGLNLTKADYVFLLDPWWNPAVEQQAIDRAHRIGQENTLFTYKFITRNSVEEKILALQTSKRRLAHQLIAPEESFVKSLSTADIESLLN